MIIIIIIIIILLILQLYQLEYTDTLLFIDYSAKNIQIPINHITCKDKHGSWYFTSDHDMY